jgi:hypothetical protein
MMTWSCNATPSGAAAFLMSWVTAMSALDQPQRRLAHRFDRGDAGKAEPGFGQRLGVGAHHFAKAAEMRQQRLRAGFTSPCGLAANSSISKSS